ncbi:MAG TPA: hypothetical protein VJG49_03510 [Candidatus Nanoarchaeia archaeon]|nr:hypothetical protein [Candidatus Nanoarchaeia archaeon]
MKTGEKMKGVLLLLILLLALTVLFSGCTPAEEADENVADINNQAVEEQENISESEEANGEQEETNETGAEESDAAGEELAAAEIMINNDGFSPKELTVKIGEKVTFVNNREGNLKKALVNGNRQCVKMKSPILNPGDTFEWVFEEAQTCTVVEAITTTQIMVITVIE